MTTTDHEVVLLTPPEGGFHLYCQTCGATCLVGYMPSITEVTAANAALVHIDDTPAIAVPAGDYDTDRRVAVIRAIDRFCEMAANHPDTPRHDWGVYGFRPDKPGRKFTRIIQTINDPIGGATKDSSVHCFVDNLTGDLLKAEGWKKPAAGVRYNLLTEWDVIVANFGWASGYLYADYKRKPVA